MLINERDQEEIIIYAFRYTLGRCTYAPHLIMQIIKNKWWDYAEGTRALFISEILEANDQDQLGHDCDKAGWLEIARLPIRRENDNEPSTSISE